MSDQSRSNSRLAWMLAPGLVRVIAIVAAISFLPITAFGVLDLLEGDLLTGTVLLACVLIGVPSFAKWWQAFR